jgi:hypothetical protein
MGFGLSTRFFSISLSLLVGSERRLVMVHRGEREANVVSIRSKAGSLHLRPNSACKLVSGGARSSQPSCPRSSGAGPRRQVQICATALKPEPGAAHCHLGAERRWSLSSSSRLFRRFARHCGRSRRGGSACGEPRADGNLAGLSQAPQSDSCIGQGATSGGKIRIRPAVVGRASQ